MHFDSYTVTVSSMRGGCDLTTNPKPLVQEQLAASKVDESCQGILSLRANIAPNLAVRCDDGHEMGFDP